MFNVGSSNYTKGKICITFHVCVMYMFNKIYICKSFPSKLPFLSIFVVVVVVNGISFDAPSLASQCCAVGLLRYLRIPSSLLRRLDFFVRIKRGINELWPNVQKLQIERENNRPIFLLRGLFISFSL